MKGKKASLTVEAALVLPVFIYAVIAFLYFLQVLYIQEDIQAGLTEVAKYASKYAYIYEDIKHTDGKENKVLMSLEDAGFFHLKLKEYIDVERVNHSCIQGGVSGISMIGSSFMDEDKIIDVIAMYRIKFPLLFFKIKGFTIVQRVRTRGFVGTCKWNDMDSNVMENNKNTKEQIVYITENGVVYHLKKECTHLKLSIRATTISELEGLRNQGGGKYKKCEMCFKEDGKQIPEMVYITNYGDRYHSSLNCSGLKRTIVSIPLSKVKNRSRCTRCGNDMEE